MKCAFNIEDDILQIHNEDHMFISGTNPVSNHFGLSSAGFC